MKISKRQQVSLREVWPLETDFSNWLVTEAGLSLIAEDIGIQVEDPKRESRPGNFPCDIVGHEVGDETHVIVIENQYGRTDHDHLGKMLTYAAVHDATTGIWISEHISDDHRQVIDWLNNNTPPTVNLFLAEIKAYRIDDSPVAPELSVVCAPNTTAKARRSESKQSVNNSGVWNTAFWEDVVSHIKDQNPPFNIHRAGIDSWTGAAVGRGGFFLALVFETKQPCIRCELCISTPWRAAAFEQLFAQRQEIEQEIGSALEWLLLPDKKITRIRLRADIDVKNEANRDAVKQWMNTQINAFYRAFRPRVQNLNAEFAVPNEIGGSGEDADEELL